MKKDKSNMKFLWRTCFLAFAYVFILLFYPGFVDSQTNVRLNSVSPSSGTVNTPIVISGNYLNRCSPPADQSFWDSRCNVQFHDIESRRTTISGTEQSNSSSTTVNGTVPTLCPGSYIIRVGEAYNGNWSNNLQFTVLDSGVLLDENGQAIQCRFITGINPISGQRGSSVVITGRNLDVNVHFYELETGTGVQAASAGDLTTSVVGTINSARTQVTFVVPSTLAIGPHTVRVGPSQSDLSNGLTFTVTSETTPPVISNVQIVDITSSSARVTWSTNELANSQVEFCQSYIRCGTNTTIDTALVTSHSVNLSGLLSNTSYYVWVKSRDGAGNLDTRGYFLFKTRLPTTPTPSPTPTPTPCPTPVCSTPPPGCTIRGGNTCNTTSYCTSVCPTPTPTPTPTPPPPVDISNIQIMNITRDSATFSWDTSIPADSSVYVCRFLFFCRATASDPNLTLNHTMSVSGLRADTNYYFLVLSRSPNGNYGRSSWASFRTELGIIISNLNIVDLTPTSITVGWDTNFPSSSTLRVCSGFFCWFGTTVSDATPVSAHLLTIGGLTPDRRYSYYVSSSDLSGYQVNSRTTTFTTPR